jgi:hypothetical protein
MELHRRCEMFGEKEEADWGLFPRETRDATDCPFFFCAYGGEQHSTRDRRAGWFCSKKAAAGRCPAQRKAFVMTLVAEKEMAQIGKTKGAENHDHDLIHELSKRLDALWRYDQYVANAEGDSELQAFWRSMKEQERENVGLLKQFIAKHIEMDCF